MTAMEWATAILAIGGASLTLVSSVGLSVMRDDYQRLHFIAPPATLGAAAFCLALWLGEPDRTFALKATLSLVRLMAANAVVTHATARALRSQGVHPTGHDRGEVR